MKFGTDLTKLDLHSFLITKIMECFYKGNNAIGTNKVKAFEVKNHFRIGLPQGFDAGIAKRNLMAVQFHPEKSQEAGLKLLKNSVEHLATTI